MDEGGREERTKGVQDGEKIGQVTKTGVREAEENRGKGVLSGKDRGGREGVIGSEENEECCMLREGVREGTKEGGIDKERNRDKNRG